MKKNDEDNDNRIAQTAVPLSGIGILQNKKVKAESIDKDQLRIHVGFLFIENELKEKSCLVLW